MTIPGSEEWTDRWTRRAVIAGLVGAAPEFVLMACGAARRSRAPQVSRAAIIVFPADRARGVDFTRPVTVTVTGGTLTAVTVLGQDGRLLGGRLSRDRTSWTSTDPLSSASRYRVTALAADPASVPVRSTASFSTATPQATFAGAFVPASGTMVGVGMPFSIVFNHPIAEKARVERAIRISASPRVEVVGHWFGDHRLDFRPERYWRPGTDVTVRLRLKDVEGPHGAFGTQDADLRYTIGRSQTTVVDLGAKRMTVTRDGEVTQTAPVSGGAPAHATWGGKMVISERSVRTRMNSHTVNLGGEYDIADVPHAQRLTTSGTFIHGNYWAGPWVFGSANTSHGCVGLRDVRGGGDPTTPAALFYASSMVGDVVEVINSGDRTVAPDNGYGCWNVPWTGGRSVAASAVSGARSAVSGHGSPSTSARS